MSLSGRRNISRYRTAGGMSENASTLTSLKCNSIGARDHATDVQTDGKRKTVYGETLGENRPSANSGSDISRQLSPNGILPRPSYLFMRNLMRICGLRGGAILDDSDGEHSARF